MKKYFNFLNIILVFIFILAALSLIFSAKKNTVTTDEGIHLFAGYTYLVKKDFRLDPEHPPFLKELSAIPLVFMKNINLPNDNLWERAENIYYDCWQEARAMSEDFLFSLGNNLNKLIFWSRFPFIIISLLIGLITYYWSKNLYGKIAGIFAAFLILFMPNMLAHGILINTDIGLALFILLSCYWLAKALKEPRWFNFIILGIFFGLAFASKYTSILLLPIIIVIIMGKIFIYDKNYSIWKKYLAGIILSLVVSFLTVWAVYGFSTQIAPTPLTNFSTEINGLNGYKFPATYNEVFLKIRSYLFPAQFYKGLALITRHSLGGHIAYLFGNLSNTGWWYYFPLAILFKTPLSFFIFLLLATVFFKKLKSKSNFDEFIILTSAILFLLLAMFSKSNLGVRHILPIFPLLAIYGSKSINLINVKNKIAVVGFTILILWYFISSAFSFSNYLAYFNELAGGPNGGYRILTDSNLDWGQDYSRINQYLTKNNIVPTYIYYPWNGDKALNYYGLNFSPISQQEPRNPQGYVIVAYSWLKVKGFSWLEKYPFVQITPGVFIFKLN